VAPAAVKFGFAAATVQGVDDEQERDVVEVSLRLQRKAVQWLVEELDRRIDDAPASTEPEADEVVSALHAAGF
jgi:hypothetical protein